MSKKSLNGGTVLFGGTSTGLLRIFSYPLSSNEYRDIPIHNGQVTAMKVTDDNYLFTVGEDGCLFIHKVPTLSSESKSALDLKDYSLVSKNLLFDHQQQISKIQKKYKDLKSRTEYELRIKELQFDETLKKIQVEAESRHQQEMSRYEELHKMKVAQELQAVDTVQALEKEHIKASEEIEHVFEKKIQEANARYEELKYAKDDMQFQLEEQMRVIQQKHVSELESLRHLYNQRTSDESEKYSKLAKEISITRVYFFYISLISCLIDINRLNIKKKSSNKKKNTNMS